MVYLTKLLRAEVGAKKRYFKNFTDSLRVFVKGGNGGNGIPKFGGVGGQGGDVVVVAKESIFLDEVYKQNKTRSYCAGNGSHSTHNFILGLPGENLKFDVPVGVTIYRDDGKKIGELNMHDEEMVIARGGVGGHPKNGFLGVKGKNYHIRLDLKLIADVGLVGFPNAGKSTLLKAISDARPKIASYPFTTIKPSLGIVSYKDFRQISVADLPGLIEGAHANRGMGHQFLKHVERTKLLLLIVDVNGFQLSPQYPARSCLDTVVLLNKELELYNPELLNKPAMILVNKMDSEGSLKTYDKIRHKILNLEDVFLEYPDDMRPERPIKFSEIMAISAKERTDDIDQVKAALRHILDVAAELEQKENDSAEMLHQLKESMREKGPRLV